MKYNLKNKIHFSALLWIAATTAFAAAQPKFSIVPTTVGGNIVQVIQGDVVRTSYQVTNNLPTTKTLVMQPIAGVTQRTRGAGVCGTKFTLAHGQSCTLNLLIDSRQMTLGTKTFQAPEICIGPTRLSCTKPWPNDLLVIDVLVIPPAFASLSVSTFDVVTATDLILLDPTGWKTITITNSGPSAATGMTYTFSPALPTGTTVDGQCPTIAAGATCVLTLNPGATPSTAGAIVPTPSVMTISGTDTHTLTVDLTVLTYSNIYQGGYVFDIDALTADRNVGGKVVTAQQPNLLQWSPIGKTLSFPNQDIDGLGNTQAIVTSFGVGQYAAYFCTNFQADDIGTACLSGQTCFKEWYLPAICEITSINDGIDCSSYGPESIANNVALGTLEILWSSTPDIANYAVAYRKSDNSNLQILMTTKLGVRCVRSIT